MTYNINDLFEDLDYLNKKFGSMPVLSPDKTVEMLHYDAGMTLMGSDQYVPTEQMKPAGILVRPTQGLVFVFQPIFDDYITDMADVLFPKYIGCDLNTFYEHFGDTAEDLWNLPPNGSLLVMRNWIIENVVSKPSLMQMVADRQKNYLTVVAPAEQAKTAAKQRDDFYNSTDDFGIF